jgi:hypothetical protein
MASSNAPTTTTYPLQEGFLKSKTSPTALGDRDNMRTNATESSLQPKEDISLVASSTGNALPDPIDERLEAAGGNSGKTSGQGSSSVQKRPASEVKSVDVAILLQTIQSQQELHKTFEKQLEVSKTQLELLHQIVSGLGGAEKPESSVATTETPKKLRVKWDPEAVEKWQRETIPTAEKVDKMRRLFLAKCTSGSFYASKVFPHLVFTSTNKWGLDEIPWPENGGTEEDKFLARIKLEWPRELIERDEDRAGEWLGGLTIIHDGSDWSVAQCGYDEKWHLKVATWERVRILT